MDDHSARELATLLNRYNLVQLCIDRQLTGWTLKAITSRGDIVDRVHISLPMCIERTVAELERLEKSYKAALGKVVENIVRSKPFEPKTKEPRCRLCNDVGCNCVGYTG